MQVPEAIRRAMRRVVDRVRQLPAAQAAARILNRLAEAGTSGYPPDVQRRLKILNMIAYLIAATTIQFAIQQALEDYATYAPAVLLNIVIATAALLVPRMHRINDLAGGLFVVAMEYVALLTFTYFFGRNGGAHLHYFIAAAAAFVVFGLERLKLVVVIVALGLFLHVYAWFSFPSALAYIKDAPPRALDALYVQAAITTMGLIGASVYYAFRLVERAKGETDALLRNILPDSIAERLKARPDEPIADSFEDASILFADISGFVALSRRLGAARVVAMLNHVVREFDALAARHGVEKIKTIGDAYMVASGIPERRDDHLERLAHMALAMQDVMERVRRETGLDLHVRIGIASGPVMAGVIGTRKFSYDVWGDAVNLAARLESQSSPGRILTCGRCREKLSGFAFESRGLVDIKGVGQQETWFLIGSSPTPSAG